MAGADENVGEDRNSIISNAAIVELATAAPQKYVELKEQHSRKE